MDMGIPCLVRVHGGVGEVELESGKNSPALTVREEEKSAFNIPDPTSLPFLLLDIRDKDAYDECHIIGSLNYPASMLSRSVNYLSKEMLLFKNKPGKIIIVYDADEKKQVNLFLGEWLSLCLREGRSSKLPLIPVGI